MAVNLLELLRQRQQPLSPIPQREVLGSEDYMAAKKQELMVYYAQQALKKAQESKKSFGIGKEVATVEPQLFDAIMALKASDKEKRDLAELSGQETSYGYAGPHISDVEESYGSFHINLKAGRIDPTTKKPFTKEGATNIKQVVKYALDEMRRTGGLGAWNPGAYPFYQQEIPRRAETKKFIRGK